MQIRIQQWGLVLLLGLGMMLPAVVEARQVDFIQKYERGKLLLRKKLYFDAVKELYQAVYKTRRGRKHFGAHYYLALAYYWRPHIQLAMQVLAQAKPLIKNQIQRNVYQKLLRRIQVLYSHIKIIPEVDPDEVGKLKVVLKPKIAFTNRHKKRYFRIVSRQLTKRGGLALDNKPFYLPKGDYELSLKMPQCLKYALMQGAQVASDIVVDGPVKLVLREKASCKCKGGQKLVKERNRLYCACSSGTGWNKKKKRCEVVKASPVPWIIIGVVGAAAVGGTIGIVYAVLSADPAVTAFVKDADPSGKKKVWGPPPPRR